MDTLFVMQNGNTEKLTAIGLNIAVAGSIILFQYLFFNPPIFADDTLAQLPASNINIDTGYIFEKMKKEISPEERSKNFDEEIRKKYPNSLIKTVSNGVKHVKMTRYYDGRPVRINVVEIDRKLASDFEIKPALSSVEDSLHSKKTITTIAKNTNSIVAINGTYFKPQTGEPLGTLMIDGDIYTGPMYDRVAIGIFDDGFGVARVQMAATMKAGDKEIKIDNINQPRTLSTHVIAYTKAWGQKAPASPRYGMQVAIEDNKVIASSSSPLEIPQNGYVIVGPKKQLEQFVSEKKVKINISLSPNWKNVRHIISGGPYLVKDSKVFVDMTAQKLGAIGGKNPRTAIGYTADNNLIMVAVDGREGSSVGMTLMQLANFMKAAGCTNAINLDGGGSTVMYVDGQVVNKPAFKGGIAISNALVVSKKDEVN